jgi:hypothetical protein
LGTKVPERAHGMFHQFLFQVAQAFAPAAPQLKDCATIVTGRRPDLFFTEFEIGARVIIAAFMRISAYSEVRIGAGMSAVGGCLFRVPAPQRSRIPRTGGARSVHELN